MTALDWAEESEHADVVEYLTNGIHQSETVEAAETVEVVLEEVPAVPTEVAEEEKKEGEEEEHVHTKAEEVSKVNIFYSPFSCTKLCYVFIEINS